MDGTKVLNIDRDRRRSEARRGRDAELDELLRRGEGQGALVHRHVSSSDGVAICARLSGVDSFYYLRSRRSDTKALKIKINNGSNSSLSSSLDSTGFAVNTWVTLRLDVSGQHADRLRQRRHEGHVHRDATATILPMGGIGLMVQRANAEFDDVIVRALP